LLDISACNLALQLAKLRCSGLVATPDRSFTNPDQNIQVCIVVATCLSAIATHSLRCTQGRIQATQQAGKTLIACILFSESSLALARSLKQGRRLWTSLARRWQLQSQPHRSRAQQLVVQRPAVASAATQNVGASDETLVQSIRLRLG
jgi:hypothetical protein